VSESYRSDKIELSRIVVLSNKAIETIAFPDARPPHLPPTPFSAGESDEVQRLLHNLDAEARHSSHLFSNLEQIDEDLISLLVDHSKTS